MKNYFKDLGLLYESMSSRLPEYLYHATYKPLLKRIEKQGLKRGLNKFWDDSSPNFIYLSDDPNVAESYAETSDMVDENWINDIVILKIDTNHLDPQKIEKDDNNLNGDTYQYADDIPPSILTIYRSDDND